MVSIPFIKELDSLPTVGLGWSQYYLGELVKVNGTIYRLIANYDAESQKYIGGKWADVTALM